MDEQYWKRSGQIPAFGNWEYVNELPITQFFECARQAGGLLRYTNSSAECELHVRRGGGGGSDLYAVELKKPPLHASGFPPPKKAKSCPQVKDQKKEVLQRQKKKKNKACDVTERPRKQLLSQKLYLPKQSTITTTRRPISAVNSVINHNPRQPTSSTTATTTKRGVDEDLYKISPELLNISKRKKRLGRVLRCLVPSCMV